jgi:hypothetical protein
MMADREHDDMVSMAVFRSKNDDSDDDDDDDDDDGSDDDDAS